MNQIPPNDSPVYSPAAYWLVEFFGKKSPEGIRGGDLETVRSHIKGLSFNELLAVIELAKPAATRPAVIEFYKQWIDLNGSTSPLLFGAWFNLGVELAASGDTANALTSYRNALALKADLYHAAVNLGLMTEAQGQAEGALDIWKNAIQTDEARTTLLNHRGRLLENLKRLEESEKELRISLLTDPNQPDVIHHWVHLRQKLAMWPVLSTEIPGCTEESLTKHIGPLAALALFDDVKALRQITEDWLTRKVAPAPRHLSPVDGYKHDKIRVGYMSSDFCMHAMSQLIAELLERHDRSAFEIYGYCSTKEDNSPIRKRVVAAFDHYVPIGHLTDEAAAQVIRDHEIDILVDLNGLTLGARLHTLRWKPAPVQLTYLGFIGPIGMPELDYILCDEFVIPKSIAADYHPKPLYMPDNYQANNSKLPPLPVVTRAECGLPEGKFVFCCFSNHYKVTETIFDAWLEILQRTDDSVLWLLGDNQWSQANLTARAVKKGIAKERLLFADRTDHPRYLARMALANLFLDTFPYNAGTITSDALRMGLPMLTLIGQSFASRMAGSLLNSVGMTEGVVTTVRDYIETAVTLATDPKRYEGFRTILDNDRWRRTIGNIELFTTQLEDVLRSIVKRPK